VTHDDSELVAIGLRKGDTVRFRRSSDEHWKQAAVMRRERDGSIGLRDEKGASRAIAMDQIEVKTAGPRGGVAWEPLVDRARRTEQLRLL
jgi:hypothetical protein